MGVYEHGGEVKMENLPTAQPMKAEKGQTSYAFLRQVERRLGVPIRKSMAQPEDDFKTSTYSFGDYSVGLPLKDF